jgi:hypothetical protein
MQPGGAYGASNVKNGRSGYRRYRECLITEVNGSTARRLHEMAAGVIRCLRPPGGWPGAVAATAASGLLLVSCTVGTTTQPTAATTQREAISQAPMAADGRHIIVRFTAGGCVRSATLTAAETVSAVTLVPAPDPVGYGLPGRPGHRDRGVTLRNPLSGRSLVDGTTGRGVPYFDRGALLRVTYLPPGYRFSAYLPFPSPSFTAISGIHHRT